MGVNDLAILRDSMPELFKEQALPEAWENQYIIIRIDDVESLNAPVGNALLPIDDLPSSLALEGEMGQGTEENPQNRVPTISPALITALGGNFAGAPQSFRDRTQMPPPDCWAFYLPFHYYFPEVWGVYLVAEGVQWLANEIVKLSEGRVVIDRAIQAARLFLYYHEAFHHKTECFATRLELTHRKPLFATGFEQFYQRTQNSDDCLEEGLANAAALMDSFKKLRTGNSGDIRDIDKALSEYVVKCPPGYNRGVEFRSAFKDVKCQFAEKNQQACFRRSKKDHRVWMTVPHMFNGIANIKSHVNYVVRRDSPLLSRLRFRPFLPPRKLVKKLGLKFVRHGGNHDIYENKNGTPVSIPRHPGDLKKGLIQKILKQSDANMTIDDLRQK